MNEKNNISDAELSLISAISGLDNKLEELDHNISLLSKENKSSSVNSSSDLELYKRVKELEDKILKLDSENRPDFGKKYLNTLPARGRFSNAKKGYVAAENLRLKRIESIEKSLNEIHKKFDEYSLQTNKIKEVNFDSDKKLLLIEALWEIVLSDEEIHDFESNLIRRLAGLLYISDVNSGNARKRALNKKS